MALQYPPTTAQRLTLTLQVVPKAASTSSGPDTRTLTIPPTGCVSVGRASGSESKNRRPSADNALFNCTVMSRVHASISAPQGQHGPVFLEDTGSMHGVSVNKKKIHRTEIFYGDQITFGSPVSHGSAIHEGIDVRVVSINRPSPFNFIARDTPTSNNISQIIKSTATTTPSYAVPDYESDTSNILDVDRDNSSGVSDIEYDDMDEEDSEFGEGLEYADEPEEFDDDELSHAGSDYSNASHLSYTWRISSATQAWNEDTKSESEAEAEAGDSFETHDDSYAATTLVSMDSTVGAPELVTFPQEEKMSIPWLVEPAKVSAIEPFIAEVQTLQPEAAHTLPQHSEDKIESNLSIVSDIYRRILQSEQPATSDNAQNLEQAIEQSVDVSNSSLIDSPIGGKRKRVDDDDGREDASAPSGGRKLLKLKFGTTSKDNLMKLWAKRVSTTTTRPTKRAKVASARVALGAFAGAVGGAATVMGFLMTPFCESLLQDWPMS